MHQISRLQYITTDNSRLGHIDQVKMVCEEGINWVQLRIKENGQEILAISKKAKEICDYHNCVLIINDHAEIAKEINASGVHLGKKDMDPSEARNLLGPDYIIGGTANTIEDIRFLESKGVNYIGLGPFRFTSTKKDLSPLLGLDGYKQIFQQEIKLPVVAIGGIEISDVQEILNAGLFGIAVSSAISVSDEPEKAARNFLSTIQNSIEKILM